MASANARRQEERGKLFPSALSNVGVAAIVAGLIGPATTGRFNAAIGLGDFLIGFGLHVAAQCVLHYVVVNDGAKPATEAEP